MSWNFERVAGPCNGATGGLAWDGAHMLFSAVKEERILSFDPKSAKVSEFRRYTGRTNGIAIGLSGSVYGAQEGGRRVIEFKKDGSTVQTCDQLDGKYHNQPTDLAIDSKGRLWIADAFNDTPAYGPPIFPFLDHASVLRLERDAAKAWTLKRVTFDTQSVRAIALSADEKALYVAEGDTARPGKRELRVYPILENGSVGRYKVIHEFGMDDRGAEGLCVDRDGHLIACAGSASSGVGAMLYVFSPSGALIEKHPAPSDMPMRCAFGDHDLSGLYLTTGSGDLFHSRDTGRKGSRR